MEFFSVHFIRPGWLLAIPLAVLIPVIWRFMRRPSGDWSNVCDEHLLRWLSVGKQSRKPGIAGQLAAGITLLAAAVALAGPSLEKLPDSSFSARDSRVLVLDLSLSMLAEDLRPNRLTQVRFRLMDMLSATREGQMGLVAYAGDAYVVSPLTSDMNTIANMLPALQPDIIPVAGSRADRGLTLAAELFERAGITRGEILLITDDADAAAVDTAARLAASGFAVSALAVGTREGAPIPSGGGFVSAADGSVVIARLQTESLAALVAAGNGRLSLLDASSNPESPWMEAGGGEFTLRDDALGDRWKDGGPWIALLLLPFVAFGFRRGLLFSLPLLMLPMMLFSAPASANWWDDIWQRKDQQAQQALRENRADAAAQLATDPVIAGEAWYRSGDYARAVQSWSQGNEARDSYNRGNALALAGEYEAAIAAYDEALSVDPEMEDALYNRAVVEQLKQQQDQENEQGEQDGEQQEGESEEDSEQEGEQQEGEGEEGEEGEQQEGEQQEPSEQEMEVTWSEEDAQAMEQWLRRIPDDPGGLLRRKFRNQHQKRGAPQDESKKW